MYAWSFAVRTADEVVALLGAMQGHRYLQEVDHRLHFTIDRALAEQGGSFAAHAAAFEPPADLMAASDRADPGLWRPAPLAEVAQVIERLWAPGREAERARGRLREVLREAGIANPGHEPFGGDVDHPPAVELVLLDWVLLAPAALDAERHAGALRALGQPPAPDVEDEQDAGPAVADAAEPVYVEGPSLGEPELCDGVERGLLWGEWMLWADGPYRYCDYVFRGVARAARLVDPPCGYRDVGCDDG
jgi:hypothetical protein